MAQRGKANIIRLPSTQVGAPLVTSSAMTGMSLTSQVENRH